MGRHRIGWAFGGAQQDAAANQQLEAHSAQHRELQYRPEERQEQQRVPGLDVVGDEADDNGGEGEDEEERRPDQSELFRTELEFVHDRLGGEADHHLVGEVDQHEEEDQGRDAPSPFGGPVLQRHAPHMTRPAYGAQGFCRMCCGEEKLQPGGETTRRRTSAGVRFWPVLRPPQ